MAEKFFELLLSSMQNSPEASSFPQWFIEKFRNPDCCSLEEFASFFLSLVKKNLDEFLKNNTSTCNTPRKLTVGNIAENAAGISSVKSSFNKQNALEADPSTNKKVTENRGNPSRQLFIKHEMNASSPMPNDFQVMNSPIYNRSGIVETSTPMTSFSKSQRSLEMSSTSTPNSFKNSKNSFSINDQSPMTFRNNSRNSFDISSKNNSNRRNTSSPFCLGDFIGNASNSGKGKKKNLSQNVDQTPTFNSSDFPSIRENSPNIIQPRRSENKPKKRVVPITISTKSTPNSSNFISSSFQSDNNLLNLTGNEAEGGFDILSERRMLRDEREAISKDFTTDAEPRARNLHAFVRESFPSADQPRKAPTFKFDDTKVERKDLLLLMAKTYSFLIDINLVPNILSEFTYLFSILNIENEPIEQVLNQSQLKSTVEIASSLLKNLHNSVFFAIQILNTQKQNLSLLDIMTIRVILDNEKTQELTGELHDYLKQAVQMKTRIDTSLQSHTNAGNNLKQVFFQQETDNRDNFPSDREFGAFKKQRDLFYTILRAWEIKHLEANYDFRLHLETKIRTLVTHMEHPVNMAHLARLFTAQLIISCTFDNAANELQMVLPNIDPSKLSKLRQRLVAPSQFSTQYLFPGSQAFFRDFITCCDHHMIFMEQLKISLINELMQINDSTMEVFSITRSNDDEKTSVGEEFIVRSEAMTTMRVIAKFVGFVISRPYSYEGYRNTLVDQKQSEIRNFLHPDFDVKHVVLRSIDENKLLVTIPWLVEYLSMLDFVTIRLNYYRDLFQLLQKIYLRVNVVIMRGSLCVLPTSKFIIRSCLGWLFEHPVIPEEYTNSNNIKEVLNEFLSYDSEGITIVQPNPYLESILNSACPFLADFRVSMMPQQTTKVLSRTGRYRHITTKFQDKPSAVKLKAQDNKSRLIEAFLASQTISVRKIVDFTIDRVSSAVVKDFQVKHLLTIKKQAKLDVEELARVTANSDLLVKKISDYYLAQLNRLQETWTEEIKTNTIARVESAFHSLLPVETLPDVKKTLINITLEKTNDKLQEWSSANLLTIEIFSKDIQSDALKLKEKLKENGKASTKNIVIDLKANTLPSEFFSDLQHLLHKASLYPAAIESGELLQTIEKAIEIVEKQNFAENAFRNIAFFMLQAIMLCTANRCELVTQDTLKKLFELWRHEKLSSYTIKSNLSVQTSKKGRKVDDYIFSNVISSRLILILQGKPRINLETYADFLAQLVKENFITIAEISEQSVRIYKYEWSTQCLNDIAFLISRVKSLLPSAASPDSQLFMELVADIAKDMENF